jgi:hypothetical protein
MLALGLATPVAAAGLTAVMLTALRTAIWKDGVKPATGEFAVLRFGGMRPSAAGCSALVAREVAGRQPVDAGRCAPVALRPGRRLRSRPTRSRPGRVVPDHRWVTR